MSSWELCQEKREGRCDECKQLRQVAFIADPYLEEMNNEVIEKWLCRECYEEALWDI
jgi:hypothetical protein